MPASTPLALSAATAILKELAPTQAIYQVNAQKEPLLGLIKTRSDFYSDTRPVIINYASNQSVGRDFATAQAIGGQQRHSRFEVDKHLYYGFVRISRHLMLAAKKDKGAFIDAMKSEIDGVLTTLRQELPFQLYGNGFGSRGTVNAISGAGNISFSLVDVKDIHKFAVGMTLRSWTAATPPVLTGAKATVVSITPSTGLVTTDIDLTAGGWAGTHYVVRDNDGGEVLDGLLAWVPTATPSATTFFGVNRTTDPINLAGHRYDASLLSLEEGILNAHAEMSQFGGEPNVCIVNTRRWTELVKELDGALVRQNMTYVKATNKLAAEANIGYKAINLVGYGREIPVLASPFCPYNNGFLLEPESWTLDGLGGVPEVITDPDNGQVFHRDPDYDGYEARLGWIANLECNKLNDQCNIKFA